MEHTFSAFVVREVDGSYEGNIEMKHIDDLPEGEILIRVTHSCVNYKDALSMSGNRGVTKSYPHTPGVDAAGYIEQTTDERFHIGQAVVVNGFDFGMNTSGGFQEYIRVPADWVTALPESVRPLEAMQYGTAGLTAAQSIDELSRIVSKDAGPILVTGATGGVGTIAITLLIRLGYTVHAVTGKRVEQERLLKKGVAEVLDRATFLEETDRPLKKGLYAGVIDTVGGPLLASVIRFVQYGGVVTTCGNVGGAEMTLTVYPFILRGVRLIGIDAVQTPIAYREELWQRLASDWQIDLASEVDIKTLNDLPEIAEALLTSRHRGRTVIEI
ncbi:quinone oxidoreductase [Exiguobacterium indicum]|uniref:YhdH/YhfP family quinone oxidoreductase n=1 Tax=Exiguobacterium indicum TaxID=296995 RepID=UPI000736C64C|nr:YhdH/YhfP family quinone oxidoreductase [Exiguobacterium indicum]KTR60575.1 quinone oxidoreductase [Exiguobacterium indicum]